MTAVEYLVEQVFTIDRKISIEDIIKEAKKMEKKQLNEAFKTGQESTYRLS